MDRLRTLIDKICPHGVTYSKIGDVATIKCGVRITKSQIKSEGLYPVISGGINPMGYYDTYNRDEETITIVQYGTAGYVDWQEKKYWANDGCCTIIPSDKIDNRYLYHALKSKEKIFRIRNEAIPHLPQKKILDVRIPVPDLETQKRIVSILDAFAELAAELAGRKKQYRYYLNNFYSPEYLKSKRVSLKDIADIERGHGLQKSDFVDFGYPCIHYGQIFTEYDTSTCETKSYTSEEVASKLKKVHPGDLIMAITSENFETVGKCIAWMGKEDIVTSGDTAIIRLKSEVDPMYLSYWFQTDDFYKQKIKLITGTTVKRISRADIANVILPVPDIKIQNNIVEKLNKFHKYCTCLISGLPAEIERREKQYKYYLNKIFNQPEILGYIQQK